MTSGTTVTVRPDGTQLSGGWTIGGGAPSLHAATSDNSNLTYAIWANTGTMYLNFGTTTIPALGQVRTLTPRFKVKNASGTGSLLMWFWDVSNGLRWKQQTIACTGSITDVTGQATTVDSTGGEINQINIDNTGMSMAGDSSLVANVYELYIDVLYNLAPTTTVTAPTGTVTTTNTPTIEWTYSDPESDTQERYQAKIFSSDVYSAVGFNAETSEAVWESGEVFSDGLSAEIDAVLDSGITYKAYAKTADAGSNGHYGNWDDGPTFTISLATATPPATPTVVVTGDDDLARVGVRVTGATGLGTQTSQTVYIERYSAVDPEWTVIRPYDENGASVELEYTGTAWDTDFTVYDYEAPRGTDVRYRARSLSVVSGLNIYGDYSSVDTDATANLFVTGCTWIKDPLDPTLNAMVVLNQHQLELTRTETMGIHFAFNRPDPLVIHGTVHSPSFSLSLFFDNDESYYNWKTMQDSQNTLLLQTGYGDGGQPPDNLYFVAVADVTVSYLTTDSMSASQWRIVSFTAQEVVAP